MRKFIFLALTILSISCQTNTDSPKVREKVELTEVNKPEKLWYTEVDKAINISKITGKPIFVFFTGKEWCSWCKKLDYQVLKQEGFINYAKENLVLLELDFPKGKRDLPFKQIELARKFRIQAYPTVILMDSHKNQLGRTGYQNLSPEKYAEHIKSIIEKK